MFPESYSFLGINVHALNMNTLHYLIDETVSKNRKTIIAHHNMHSLYIYHHDPMMQEFFKRADYVNIDGMPLVFLGRLLGYPLGRRHRIAFVDWIRPLMWVASRQGWSVFFLGSKPGVAAKAASILKEEIPHLQLETKHGYFDSTPASEENQEVLQHINTYRPNILMVGMGMPRQEHWVMNNLSDIHANVILTAGACMDYVAKMLPIPPRWLGQLGLEWSYRLLCEPKRLWLRYLLEPWFVLKLLAREMIQ